jgi:hypothetical protein
MRMRRSEYGAHVELATGAATPVRIARGEPARRVVTVRDVAGFALVAGWWLFVGLVVVAWWSP